jgi:hypothetical protein
MKHIQSTSGANKVNLGGRESVTDRNFADTLHIYIQANTEEVHFFTFTLLTLRPNVLSYKIPSSLVLNSNLNFVLFRILTRT